MKRESSSLTRITFHLKKPFSEWDCHFSCSLLTSLSCSWSCTFYFSYLTHTCTLSLRQSMYASGRTLISLLEGREVQLQFLHVLIRVCLKRRLSVSSKRWVDALEASLPAWPGSHDRQRLHDNWKHKSSLETHLWMLLIHHKMRRCRPRSKALEILLMQDKGFDGEEKWETRLHPSHSSDTRRTSYWFTGWGGREKKTRLIFCCNFVLLITIQVPEQINNLLSLSLSLLSSRHPRGAGSSLHGKEIKLNYSSQAWEEHLQVYRILHMIVLWNLHTHISQERNSPLSCHSSWWRISFRYRASGRDDFRDRQLIQTRSFTL